MHDIFRNKTLAVESCNRIMNLQLLLVELMIIILVTILANYYSQCMLIFQFLTVSVYRTIDRFIL